MEKQHVIERESNYDLLRIISMCGVICLHILGKLIPITSGTSNGVIIDFLRTFSFVSVNIFAIMTGYFGYRMKRLSLISRCFEVLFYCVVISFIGNMIFEDVTKQQFISYLFPFFNRRLWYFWAYSFCCMVSPYINFFVSRVEEKDLKHLIIVLFLLLSCVTTVLNNDLFRILDSGYSAVWLMYLYLIGAYIRKFGIKIKINLFLAIAIIIINTCITMYSKTFLSGMGKLTLWNKDMLYKYSSPLFVVNSCLIVMIFHKYVHIRASFFTSVLGFLAKGSFAVYIIHAHPLLLDRVWYNASYFAYLHNHSYGVIVTFLLIILTIIAIYIACIIIEFVRDNLFKLLRIKVLTRKLDNCLYKMIKIE